MNRRGTSTLVLVVAAIVVLAVVAGAAFMAGAAMGGGRYGWTDGMMGRSWMGGWGLLGGGLGFLITILVIVGIVWAVLTLLRPSDRYPPGPPNEWRQPPAAPPGPGIPPVAPPAAPPAAAGREAFEAWHREAHAEGTPHGDEPVPGGESETPPSR